MDEAPQERTARLAAGVRVGRVFGVPVYLSLSTVLLVAILAFGYAQVLAVDFASLHNAQTLAVAVAAAILLVASVFLHELGHCVVSQAVGIRVRSITLFVLGGVTQTEGDATDPGRAYVVAVAGPLVSLALAGFGAVLAHLLTPGTIMRALVAQVTITNLLVTGFNLLPGLPLDGGQLLRAGVWKLSSDKVTGTRTAAWAGRGIALALVGFAVFGAVYSRTAGATNLFLLLFVALFVWQGATHALRASTVAERVPRVHAGALARPALAVPADMPLAEALRRLRAVGARGIVVVDGSGRPTAVVVEASVSATPEQRRPWVTVGALARSLGPGLTLPARLAGEEVIRAIQATPASEYVVVDDAKRLVGVLATADVAGVLDPATTR